MQCCADIYREFKDVVFEGVVFDNHSSVTPCYITYKYRIRLEHVIIKHHVPELRNIAALARESRAGWRFSRPCTPGLR